MLVICHNYRMNQKSDKKIRADLERIHEWASGKIGAGNEPPWAWYQYMKLRETVDAILGGMAAVTPTGSLRQREQQSGSGLRLVASNDPQDVAQPHRGTIPTRLPT